MNKTLHTVVSCIIGMSVVNDAGAAITLKAGGGAWSAELDGTIQDQDFMGGTGTEIDFSDTLGFEESNQTVFYAQLEHPVPGIPNIRVAYTELKFNETTTLAQPVDIDDRTFNGTVESTFDLTHVDATLYYQVFDSIGGLFDFDLGLTGRVFNDAELMVENASAGKAQADISGVLPMLYTEVMLHIPTTGLYAGVQANLLGVGGDGFYDVSFRAGWQTPWLIGIEAVHRNIQLKYDDDDDIDADFDITGTYANVFVNF